ncbi:FapA family protein [Alkalibacter mobilis]|uniref:FapA family protein n=1 Tax=Alkalibacter mobilis TaxID=2787712 RepID=UPI00189DCEC2|nr:FapA family protein [Alkalibacter mobilis]MBF7096365.1 FapA family protein [Alkalibacter mobilis]
MIFETFCYEDALEKAVEHFKCSADKLKVTVLEEPSSKMMGLIKKTGKFSIEKKPENEVVDAENENGSIEVKNGEIIITNPKGKGVAASVFFKHPQMSVKINGNEVKGTVLLYKGDELEFEYEDILPSRRLIVDFSDEMVEAYLTVERINGKRFSMKDIGKTSKTVFDPNEEIVFPEELTIEECKRVLLDYGILEEKIDRSEIKRACESNDTIKVTAARGKAPVVSAEAVFEYCEEIFVKEILRGLEPVVMRGKLLAQKVSAAVVGIPGEDVKGNEIKVKPVVDKNLGILDGAIIQGEKVYALIDGRPYIKRDKIGVVPLLTVIGDLDKESDDIDFDGDVVVKGNVQDNMFIRATGNIAVIGSVYHSNLIAQQNVEVNGKVIGGRISAGDESSAFRILIPYMETMVEEMEKIFTGLHTFDGKNVRNLLETINNGKDNLEKCISEIERTAKSLNDSQLSKINKLKNDIRHSFIEIKLLHQEGFQELNGIYIGLLDDIKMMKEEVSDSKTIKVTYAQSAVLNSSGDVIITGEGSYQSKITAGGNILFQKPTSVVKGGALIAVNKIRAGIVGTPGEIETYCKVLSNEGDITGRFHKGTTLIIKDRQKDYTAIEV